VTLPNGRPVWGGTYFRKDEWINTLEQLQQLYESDPTKMLEYAERLHQGIESLNFIETTKDESEPQPDFLANLVIKWGKSFDW